MFHMLLYPEVEGSQGGSNIFGSAGATRQLVDTFLAEAHTCVLYRTSFHCTIFGRCFAGQRLTKSKAFIIDTHREASFAEDALNSKEETVTNKWQFQIHILLTCPGRYSRFVLGFDELSSEGVWITIFLEGMEEIVNMSLLVFGRSASFFNSSHFITNTAHFGCRWDGAVIIDE